MQKKMPFICFLLFFQQFLFAQTKEFILYGSIDNFKNGKIEIFITQYENGRKYKGFKGVIKNHKFRIKGNLNEPAEAMLVINDTISSCNFFIEPRLQKTTIKQNSIKKEIVLDDSKTNIAYLNEFLPLMQEFKDSAENWYVAMENLEKANDQHVPIALKDSMEAVFEGIRIKKDSAIAKYNINHPGSFVALWGLFNRILDRGHKELFENTCAIIAPHFKNSEIFDAVTDMLHLAKLSAVGVPFPSVSVTDINGYLKGTGDVILNNKFTLVDFWFSNCLPCLQQFTELKELYSVYNKRGFNIIGISVDADSTNWKKAITANQLSWPQYLDPRKKTALKLLIHAYPSNFLIDKKGVIIAKNIEPYEVEKYLLQNL